MPPNTVLLSVMMQELSAVPGFTEAMLAELDHGSKQGPAMLTPRLLDLLRQLILGKDWRGLNRFPGWTMREIDPAVRVVSHVFRKDEVLEDANPAAKDGVRVTPAEVAAWIDMGPLAIDRAEHVALDEPSTLPGFSPNALVSDLGHDVVRGDGPDPAIAPMHPESARLAMLLNRLSLNELEGAAPVSAGLEGHVATTPEALMDALVATGHTITVADARYFANFGHLHFKGQDVMMPFWVNSQITVPGMGRPLMVPVSHAEYEWFIRGPRINADVAFYFGIDGKAEFRTMEELNQPWVLGRHAHEYRGGDAREVTRLNGRMALAYMRQHIARPTLPFGGYYTLGVCQDTVAAIEKKMTGKATLFPNTADAALFNDGRDAEVNALIAAIPKDRAGAAPEPERIFGSLPTTDLGAITIPGLGDDLERVQKAWHAGTLGRAHGPLWRFGVGLLWIGGLSALFLLLRRNVHSLGSEGT